MVTNNMYKKQGGNYEKGRRIRQRRDIMAEQCGQADKYVGRLAVRWQVAGGSLDLRGKIQYTG